MDIRQTAVVRSLALLQPVMSTICAVFLCGTNFIFSQYFVANSLVVLICRPVNMENSLDSLQQLVRSCIAIGAETDDNLTDFHIFLISQAIRSFYLIKSTSCDGVLMDFESETLLSILQ